jgi:hypothetical protein
MNLNGWSGKPIGAKTTNSSLMQQFYKNSKLEDRLSLSLSYLK